MKRFHLTFSSNPYLNLLKRINHISVDYFARDQQKTDLDTIRQKRKGRRGNALCILFLMLMSSNIMAVNINIRQTKMRGLTG